MKNKQRDIALSELQGFCIQQKEQVWVRQAFFGFEESARNIRTKHQMNSHFGPLFVHDHDQKA